MVTDKNFAIWQKYNPLTLLFYDNKFVVNLKETLSISSTLRNYYLNNCDMSKERYQTSLKFLRQVKLWIC